MYKDLSLKEKAKVLLYGGKLGLTSVEDIAKLYDEAVGHTFQTKGLMEVDAVSGPDTQDNILNLLRTKQFSSHNPLDTYDYTFLRHNNMYVDDSPKQIAEYFNSYAQSEGIERIKDNQKRWYKKYRPNRNSWIGSILYDTDKAAQIAQDELKKLNGDNVYYLDMDTRYSNRNPSSDVIFIGDKVPSNKKKEWPEGFVVTHELMHRMPWKATELHSGQSDALGLNTNTEKGHDSQTNEKYGDLQGLRFMLYDNDIYDSRSKKDVTPEQIQQLRELFPNLRPLQQMNNEKAAWMLNHVVQNNTKQEDFSHHVSKGGPIVSPYGQWKYPGRDTIIPSNNITMDNVNYPVLGVSDTGDTKVMMPWNDYKFRGSMVYEHPLIDNQFQLGGLAKPFSYGDIPDVRYLKGGNTLNYLNVPENNSNKDRLYLNKEYKPSFKEKISRFIMDYAMANLRGKFRNPSNEDKNIAGIIQDTYLLGREDQNNAILSNGYIHGLEGDYGLVRSAVGNRDIPVYQRKDDSNVNKNNLVYLGWNYNADWNIPEDSKLIRAGNYPTGIYVDGVTGDFYMKSWDLNDYGNNDYYSGIHKVGSWILDKVGNPVVLTTGFLPTNANIKDYTTGHLETVKPKAIDKNLNPTYHFLNEFINKNNLRVGEYGISLPEVIITPNEYKKGGSIHIKPENRGKFTALKKRTGHSASWFKAHGTPALKKMATFALNARHWKHLDGGYSDRLNNLNWKMHHSAGSDNIGSVWYNYTFDPENNYYNGTHYVGQNLLGKTQEQLPLGRDHVNLYTYGDETGFERINNATPITVNGETYDYRLYYGNILPFDTIYLKPESLPIVDSMIKHKNILGVNTDYFIMDLNDAETYPKQYKNVFSHRNIKKGMPLDDTRAVSVSPKKDENGYYLDAFDVIDYKKTTGFAGNRLDKIVKKENILNGPYILRQRVPVVFDKNKESNGPLLNLISQYKDNGMTWEEYLMKYSPLYNKTYRRHNQDVINIEHKRKHGGYLYSEGGFLLAPYLYNE